jgi:hypothetical protein
MNPNFDRNSTVSTTPGWASKSANMLTRLFHELARK